MADINAIALIKFSSLFYNYVISCDEGAPDFGIYRMQEILHFVQDDVVGRQTRSRGVLHAVC
jgi:hypothetical protein